MSPEFTEEKEDQALTNAAGEAGDVIFPVALELKNDNLPATEPVDKKIQELKQFAFPERPDSLSSRLVATRALSLIPRLRAVPYSLGHITANGIGTVLFGEFLS